MQSCPDSVDNSIDSVGFALQCIFIIIVGIETLLIVVELGLSFLKECAHPFPSVISCKRRVKQFLLIQETLLSNIVNR